MHPEPMQFAGFLNLGGLELLAFGLIVLLLFGHRIPTMMRSLGQGVVEFKKGTQGIEDETDSRK